MSIQMSLGMNMIKQLPKHHEKEDEDEENEDKLAESTQGNPLFNWLAFIHFKMINDHHYRLPYLGKFALGSFQ